MVEKVCFENKFIISATLIDLSKLFDCTSHELLIRKLNYYGTKNLELKFVLSYLSKRKQMVVRGDDKSNFEHNCVVVLRFYSNAILVCDCSL